MIQKAQVKEDDEMMESKKAHAIGTGF